MSTAFQPANHHLLIVDDEEIVLIALRETLRREGFQVTTALDALEAVDLLRQRQFSAIMTDHQMPQLSGLDFLQEARKAQPEATRILITAALSLNAVVEAINDGEIFRFILKPWAREDLLATVRSAVEHYETTRRQREAEERGEQTRTALIRGAAQLARIPAVLLGEAHPALVRRAGLAASICREVAAALGLPAGEARALEWAGWLHDIGLAGLPVGVVEQWLLQPEALNEKNLALARQHPTRGAALLQTGDDLKLVAAAILAHHERFDGNGFPARIAGDNIPLVGRVLALAAAAAAVTEAGGDWRSAVAAEAGGAFDPQIIAAIHKPPST